MHAQKCLVDFAHHLNRRGLNCLTGSRLGGFNVIQNDRQNKRVDFNLYFPARHYNKLVLTADHRVIDFDGLSIAVPEPPACPCRHIVFKDSGLGTHKRALKHQMVGGMLADPDRIQPG